MGLSLKQKLSIFIPRKANRTIINGKTYSIDINEKGLYCLVSNKEYVNEVYILDESFTIKDKNNASDEIKQKILNNQ